MRIWALLNLMITSYICLPVKGSAKLTGEDTGVFENRIQMLERFGDIKSIKVSPALFPVLQNTAEVMPSDFYRQRIGNDISRLPLMFDPRRMSQGDPHRTSVEKELHVYRISVTGCNRRYDALIDTANRGSGPTLDGAEIFVHMGKLYSAEWKSAIDCRKIGLPA
jgi:hypothetical protein